MNYTLIFMIIILACIPIIVNKTITEAATTTTTTTTITTTTTNSTGGSNITSNIAVLGNPIFTKYDKTSSVRSIVVNGSRILEAYHTGNGTVKGVGFTDKGVDLIATKPDGGIYSKGRSSIISKDSNEKAYYVFQAIGHYSADGKLKDTGAAFFSTNSTGRLAIVKDLVVFYKDETSRGGITKTVGWEWK
jgi:hypothetical protein